MIEILCGISLVLTVLILTGLRKPSGGGGP
jgi:hypothetical protein